MNCAECSALLNSQNVTGLCRSCSSRRTRAEADRRALPWCPDDMRADYHQFRRMGFTPSEAQRIVMDHAAKRGVLA